MGCLCLPWIWIVHQEKIFLLKNVLQVSISANYSFSIFIYTVFPAAKSGLPQKQGYNARKVILEVCASFVLGGNVNTKRMSQPDMGSIFHIKNQWNILATGNCYVNYQNYQNLMLLTSSDTKQTLMHLFLFTNSTQRDLVSICTQSIRNCN